MNKTLPTLTAITALVLASFSAQAADDTKTRAEVKAETASAMKSGTIAKGEGPAQTTPPMMSDTTRAEVKADAKQAVKGGKVAKGEGSPAVAKTEKGTVERSEVKAEAAQAVKDGKIGKGPNVPVTGGVAKP